MAPSTTTAQSSTMGICCSFLAAPSSGAQRGGTTDTSVSGFTRKGIAGSGGGNTSFTANDS
eukprot:CAMPEP_0204297192 /NCGR_PEP_ID=MMETSP0468-20130131/72754_1 /ASSEMBLY_ACC=CAM_ASM_000383 /TAXON_ID=2969 /ORGANISM="Oxyrrhis marina" /LENGTH=60 /DNA_ID=CAMNT_0051275967 /DNA_START=282 /DNA_END=460 /DNA_ORIENTATION=+